MAHVVKRGNDDLIEVLMPPGRRLLDYSKSCPRFEVIEAMLECGYMRRDEEAAMAIRDLAGGGHLELIQQIALVHSPLRENYLSTLYWCNYWVRGWFGALVGACKCGKLETVKWLVQYPIGIRVSDFVRSDSCLDAPISRAAKEGHWEIIQFLSEQQIAKDFDRHLAVAIRSGHIKCVEVMIYHYLKTRQRPRECPIDIAAGYGRLEVVQFLHNFRPQDQSYNETSGNDAWWAQSQKAIVAAASSGNLELVKWLHFSGYNNCANNAMDAAAGAGHLHVVKWLHHSRAEGCTPNAMHEAASNGHLSVLQWLHSNRDEGCMKHTMVEAAICGSLDIFKWLDANNLGTCSADVVNRIFRDGPLRVASWLSTRFPEQVPVNLNGTWNYSRVDMFEMLLLLEAHCPQCIHRKTEENVGKLIPEYAGEDAVANLHILNWLEDKNPSMGIRC